MQTIWNRAQPVGAVAPTPPQPCATRTAYLLGQALPARGKDRKGVQGATAPWRLIPSKEFAYAPKAVDSMIRILF